MCQEQVLTDDLEKLDYTTFRTKQRFMYENLSNLIKWALIKISKLLQNICVGEKIQATNNFGKQVKHFLWQEIVNKFDFSEDVCDVCLQTLCLFIKRGELKQQGIASNQGLRENLSVLINVT